MMFGCDEAGGRLGLPMKSGTDVGIVLEIRHQYLQRHVAPHRGIVRPVHHSHGAAADLLDDLIPADLVGEAAPGTIVSGRRHVQCSEQRTTSAVMLSRLPCSSAVLIRDWASRGSSSLDATMLSQHLVGHRSVQTVGTEQQRLVARQRAFEQMDLRVRACAEHVGQDVPRGLGPAGAVLVAQHGGRPRIVGRQLRELGSVAQVQPAVADVRHNQLAVGNERAHNGRAHPEIIVMVLGEPIDSAIGEAYSRLEAIALVTTASRPRRTAMKNRRCREIGG